MNWVDVALALVLGISVCIGLYRGLVFEVMSLVGWLVAYLAAGRLSPWLAPYLPIGTPGSGLHHGACFAGAFIVILLLWALISRLIRMLIHATVLSVADRLLGALFGGVRGVLILLSIATVVSFTPAAQASVWKKSVLTKPLEQALHQLKPLLLVSRQPSNLRVDATLIPLSQRLTKGL